MPLYDTLTLGGDKQPIVFEFGYAFTRCGFVNESTPRVVRRSQSSTDKSLMSITDASKLFIHLRDFIEDLYFRYLAVNPRDRKVILVESVFCSTLFRLTVAKVLFSHFDVPGIILLPGHLMALNTLMVNTALVVDVGYTECSVTPVVEGVTVLDAVHFNSLGSKAIHQKIREELISSKAMVSKSGQGFHFDRFVINELSESVLEDIKVRACFVPSFTRGQKLVEAKINSTDVSSTSPPSTIYPLQGHLVLNIPGIVRETAAQVMFELVGNESTVASMILDAISFVPIDCRKVLASNIVLIGGTTMMPGFKKRLSDELENLVATEREYKDKVRFKEFKFHKLPCPANYAAWLGSAIYGSTEAISSKVITSKEFDQSRGLVLSDWSNWWPTMRPARILF